MIPKGLRHQIENKTNTVFLSKPSYTMTNFFGFLHNKPDSKTPAHPVKTDYEETTDFLHKLDLQDKPEPKKEEASPVTIPGGFPDIHSEYTLHYTSSPPQSDTLPWNDPSKPKAEHATVVPVPSKIPTPVHSKIPTPVHTQPSSPVQNDSPWVKPLPPVVDVHPTDDGRNQSSYQIPSSPAHSNPPSPHSQNSDRPWLQSRPSSPKPLLPNRPITPTKGDLSTYYSSLDQRVDLKPPSPNSIRPPSPHYSTVGSRPSSPNYASIQNSKPSSPRLNSSFPEKLSPPPTNSRPYSPTNIRYHQNLPPSPPKDDVTVRIENIISKNQLEAFYPPGSYNELIKRIKSIDVPSLAKGFGVPEEICKDLFALALYDIVIFADDSGSMQFEDGGERIETLKTILSRVAQIGTLFDDDGIAVRFFNGDQLGDNITNAKKVDNLIAKTEFVGITPIGTNLESKVLAPMVYEAVSKRAFKKPLLVFIITDGEPSGEDEDTLIKVIDNCQQFLQKFGLGHGVGIQVSQVGQDLEAQKYLTMLEDHAKDIVATTPNYELLQERYRAQHIHLTFEHWLLQLMLGPIKF
ncbi:hypothetical protein HK103_003504 [Boothiomyces macroporosus]|uniref:VWFA domain-containing protein n=1 Tax=Boothiomyces macroporosus TaxID=261099 RepID=A0AAD5UHT1_9FUNG|nr:hypothetical protein HK103_003504 [Boothiomyces macroporosus]